MSKGNELSNKIKGNIFERPRLGKEQGGRWVSGITKARFSKSMRILSLSSAALCVVSYLLFPYRLDHSTWPETCSNLCCACSSFSHQRETLSVKFKKSQAKKSISPPLEKLTVVRLVGRVKRTNIYVYIHSPEKHGWDGWQFLEKQV